MYAALRRLRWVAGLAWVWSWHGCGAGTPCSSRSFGEACDSSLRFNAPPRASTGTSPKPGRPVQAFLPHM